MQAFLTKLPFIIIIGLGVIVVIVILVFSGILPGKLGTQDEDLLLQFWGFDDSENKLLEIFSQYKKEHKNISIAYRRIDPSQYESVLINSLAEGRGPDIFMLKNSWISKHKDKIFPLPQAELGFSTVDFTRQFADISAQDLISPNAQILGLPIFVDTPALLYNKDEFNAAAISQPPRTWDELSQIAQKFTRKNSAGDILKSGVAIGTGDNTERAFEILASLFFQYGDPIVDPVNKNSLLRENSQKALSLYTSFANPGNKSFAWSERMPPSLQALAEGNAVMTIGLSQDVARLRNLNSHLNVGISDFPQRDTEGKKVLYGSYFFPTVSIQSQQIKPAWQFLLFLSAGQGARIYEEKTSRPPARRDLIAAGPLTVSGDSFWRQALIARDFIVPGEEQTRTIFSEAISSVLSKSATPVQAVQTLATRLNSLLFR